MGSSLLAGCGQAAVTTTPPAGLHRGTEIRAAHLFTPTSGWVLTADRLLSTNDRGTTWTDVSPPSNSMNAPVETVFFLNPSKGWAVVRSSQGSFTSCDQAPLDLFTSSDGGRHWSARRLPATTMCDTPGPVYLTFLDAMHGWLVVDRGSHAGFMYYSGYQTIDGGRTWTTLPYPQSAPVLFVNQLDGFSVGGGDGPKAGAYGTHDGGRTWSRLAIAPAGGSAMRFELPVFSDQRNGVLAGHVVDASGGTAAVVFYTTSDGGRFWSLAATVPNPDTHTSARPGGVIDGKVWLAAFLGSGPTAGRTYTRIKVTHDAGRTWEWTPGVLTGVFTDEISFAGSTGWGTVSESGCLGFKTDCFTNWNLYQTVDGGAHWLQLSLA